jgi:hypothetical protein
MAAVSPNSCVSERKAYRERNADHRRKIFIAISMLPPPNATPPYVLHVALQLATPREQSQIQLLADRSTALI